LVDKVFFFLDFGDIASESIDISGYRFDYIFCVFSLKHKQDKFVCFEKKSQFIDCVFVIISDNACQFEKLIVWIDSHIIPDIVFSYLFDDVLLF